MDRQAGVEWAQAILPAAERLLEAARGAGLIVVHTREGYAADLSDCSAQRQLRSQSAGAAIGSPGPLGRLLVRGEAGHAIVDRLAPLSSELVIDKTTYGAFHGTQLASLIASRGIEHLLFAGVAV